MATLQGKAVKNTYRQVLQIGANNVGVSGTLQPVQDGAGVNTALSLSTAAATINGTLTITGDLIITGGGIQITDLIDDTVASLIQNGTGITWTYNDGARTLTGNFTGTTSVVPEGSNLYYTQGRFDSAFAAKSTTNLAEGTNLYFTTARGNANFATNLAASDTDDLAEGTTNLYYANSRARLALSVTAGTGISYDNTTGVFNLAAIPNASLTNSSITINSQSVALGGSVTLTTTNIAEGTNLYWTNARFDSRFGTKTTTDLAEGTNLYYTQARFNSALAAKTTTDLAEGTNLYYTDARARLALSSSATGLSYANNSGVFSLTAGYAIPTTVKLGQYDTAYNRSIVSAAVSGTGTKTLSLTQQDANVVSATWTDLGITTINGTANQIATTTVGNTTTVAFTNDVTMPNNLIVSGNLTINGTATYVNTQSISAKDPLFEVANDNNTTDAVDIGYYGRYYDTPQTRVEFTGLFRDASDAGKFKFFTGLVDEPTNVVNTTGTGYTVGTLVANFEGNLAGTANAANVLSTARTIAASGDATWSVSFDGSANVSSALTLANTGVTATTYGTSTSVPTIAVDGKGRITSASNTNITFPVTTVNGFAGTVVLTTSDVAEGTNQYFTTARAQAAITGGASSVVTANLTVSRALVSDGSGKIAASATTTTTEIGYLAGVTSALQTQLNGKLNLTGGTLTGGLTGTTGSFSGILTTPQVKAATSGGLSINANSGTQVADFGAGGSANITFFGGLSGTSATFSSSVTATNGLLIGNGGATPTTNYLPKFTGASTIGNSVVYESSGSVYLGTAYVLNRTNTGGYFTGVSDNFGFTYDGTAANISNGSATPMKFFTSGALKMTLDASGNLGLGVTPSAWAFYKALQVQAASIANFDNADNTIIGSNVFYGGSPSDFRYISTGTSTMYRLNSGIHSWSTAASGTAGAAISFTQAMTLTATGNLGVGTSAGNVKLYVRAEDNTSTTKYGFYVDNGTTDLIYVRNDGLLSTGNSTNSPYNYSTTGRTPILNSGGILGYLVSTRESKDNIESIKNADVINQLNPVQFNYRKKDDKTNTFTDELEENITYGFIADEVEKVNKDLVFYDNLEDGTKKLAGVEYNNMIAILTKAVQELTAKVKALEAK